MVIGRRRIKIAAKDDVVIRPGGGGEENIAAIKWDAKTAGTAEVTAEKIAIAISNSRREEGLDLNAAL